MERSLTIGGFNTLSDENNFIVVYPDGIERHWNDGRKNTSDAAHEQNIDDVGFFDALMENLTNEFNIDTNRIYCTGISNGAMMSYRLALELPKKIAAIAPVAVPVLAVRTDGGLGIGGALFGRKNPYRRYGKFLRRRLDPAKRWRIGISHANVPEGASAVREVLARALQYAEFLPVIPLGTALGAHGGPGCVVVAAQEL